MNASSSRSHCVVTLQIARKGGNGETTMGKLCLVDLAGSERAGRTKTEGHSLAEGSLINLSLSSLTRVVSGLTDEAHPKTHIPYRSSKLTRLLQDVLGPGSHTVLILCVSSAAVDAQETLSTLRFGARAKHIPAQPARRIAVESAAAAGAAPADATSSEHPGRGQSAPSTKTAPRPSHRTTALKTVPLRRVRLAMACLAAVQACAVCWISHHYWQASHLCMLRAS
ncbi:hypothetical protein ACKKBF_B12400 [Auxenochlorella protothecoides x Auxenochlorella symbiontica]